MEIRKYEPEDSAGVKNFILSILEKEYPFHRNVYQTSDINDITGTYSGEDNVFFVIKKETQIVGTVGVKRDAADSALLRRLFVEENHRKKGLGTMLLTKAIEFCRAKNYKEMVFRATDRMFEAMNLCKKLGFQETENLEVSGFRIHKFVLKL